MCGINGIVITGRDAGEPLAGKIEMMNTELAHRGPDDQGYWHSPGHDCHLGHRRLSILDLSAAGHQPMLLNDLAISFNGEIFNHLKLRREFFPDHHFQSNTDTETLLHMYQKFGEESVNYLTGMFAFAIWDQKKEKLFIARDHSGKKPLYYHFDGVRFSFSSEIKALLKLPWISHELSKEALYHFLTFNMVPPPDTLFRDISKLEPATKIVLTKKGDFQKKKYWEINPLREDNLNEEEAIGRVRETFDCSVRDRMLSDVPLGAFLSGGVDSSAVVATMRRYSDAPVKTFSVGFKGQPEYDELEWAGKVAKQFNTDHVEKIISPEDIIECLPRIITALDDPLTDVANIPIFFICQLASAENIKVVLTGDGSDELFAGYRNYMRYMRNYPYYRLLTSLPAPLRKFLASGASFLGIRDDIREMMNRAYRGHEYFWGSAGSFKESQKQELINSSFFKEDHAYDSSRIIESYKDDFNKLFSQVPGCSYLDWMTYIAYKFVSSNRFLMRMDKLGMQHAVEIRAPFLSKDLAQLAMSVPPSLKLKNNEPKYILKKAFLDRLPEDILYRKKKGFVVPIREWAADYIADEVFSNIDTITIDTPVFRKEAVMDIIRRVRAGNKQQVNNLWMIYFLTAWLNKWKS